MDECFCTLGLTASLGASESIFDSIAYALYDVPTMIAIDVYLIAYLTLYRLLFSAEISIQNWYSIVYIFCTTRTLLKIDLSKFSISQ